MSSNSKSKSDSNEKENDDLETRSNSSSNDKLKIDMGDENEEPTANKAQPDKADETPKAQQKDSAKPTTSTDSTVTPKEAKTKSKAKAAENVNESLNESIDLSQTSNGSSNVSGRKRVDRGLDGGYWSRVAQESTERKRRRTTTERLDLSSYKGVDDSMVSDDTNATGAEDDNASKHSETNTSTSKKDKYILFKARSFLTVRNETGSFFLCQSVNAINEESKKCKIQWLEDVGVNKYKYGLVDWVDPFTIISKVKVNKVGGFFEIDEDDLANVNKLLEKAIKDGGITVEFDSEDDDSSSEEETDKSVNGESKKTKAKADQYELDDEFYDKEDDYVYDIKKPKKLKDSDEDDEYAEEKKKKKKLEIESKKSPMPAKKKTQLSDDDEESDEKQAKKPKPKSTPEITKKIKEPAEKTDKNEKEKIASSSSTPKPDSNKLNNLNGNKSTSASKPASAEISKKPVEEVKKKIVKPTSDSLNKSVEKKRTNGNDTDELVSSDEEIKRKKMKKIQNKEKDANATPTISSDKDAKIKKPMPPPSPANQQNETAAIQTVQPKKRGLVKVVSNRLLEENSKVTVYVKDPFFEDSDPEIKLPFISPYVQSKLAFKAIYMGDMKMLKALIDDYSRVPSVHIGRGVYNKWMPVEYALYMENQKAVEMLIDEFCSNLKNKNDTKKRIQMPESMFEKFSSTGTYNPRSLGIPHIRKLTESRGVKEGNNALTKDQETLEFASFNSRHQSHIFFKRLFELAFEYGSTTEMFDFLMFKWNSLDENKSNNNFNNYNSRFIYDNLIKIIIFGHRKLAAHVLENAPPGNGFNNVHIEVLKADNDADLKCQLRANMCTKKPFANDCVTPIHCACINSNVKYLKTLLSITQDFNIADKKGRRPVHYAAVCEGPTPLEYLISRVSPYELDSMGNTPLNYACLAGRSMNVEVLLGFAQKKQEDDGALTTEVLIDNKYGLGGINKPNKRGQLPIHLAISRNNYECVKVLVKYGCNVEYPLPNSMGKITPLMYACQLGHYKIIKLLIENNAKIEARDRFQRTAVIHATMCGHVRPLTHLLRMGANPNVVDSSGNSALHYACAYGWFYSMRALLDAGANVNVANDWKLTPFGASFLKGHVGLCDQLLLLHKNQIDINFRTEDGETLVMLSVSSSSVLNEGSVDQLNYIVNKLGGDCKLVDSNGNNAFHYLASNKVDESLFKDQVTAEKTLEQIITEQETYRYKMADILLKAGCNPNAQNNELETPLFSSIASCNFTFARYLLTKKETNCQITSQQNPNGKTLLSLMAENCLAMDVCYIIFGSQYNDRELIKKYAKEFEAMARIKDEHGKTPFQIACIKLNETLSANVNNPDYVIPENLTRFIKFLYKECNSNPNEVIVVKDKTAKKNTNQKIAIPARPAGFNFNSNVNNASQESDSDSNDGLVVIENADADDEDEEREELELAKSKKAFSTPIFKLIDDKCVDLLESLVGLMNDERSSLININFNFFDSNGLTPLLTSIVKKQTKFALKLIELGVYSPLELANQKSRNTLVYMGENLLQFALRYDQLAIFEKIIELMCSSKSNSTIIVAFIELLQHQNVYKQNLFHVLASMKKSDANSFTSSFLNEFTKKINNYFSHAATLINQNDKKNILVKLMSSKDKLGRNPLHLCLMNNDAGRANIDLEIFFAEQIFNHTFYHSESFTQQKKQIFAEKDMFGRLPLHYLFFSLKQFETNTYKSHNLYKLANSELDRLLNEKLSINFGQPESISVIDPVELLTILIKQTDKSLLDEKDIYGYTALHYAAIRGSCISSSLLMSNNCDFMSRAKIPYEIESSANLQANSIGNTPLSSSIYFKRETCVLTFLRCIEEKNKQSQSTGIDQIVVSLKDNYFLNENEFIDESAKSSLSDEKEATLKWLSQNEKDLYPVKYIPLYKLILSYKWEGISWLILGNLESYGINFFDSLQSSISSLEFNLTLRLLEKLERQLGNPADFINTITAKSSTNHGRTLLHLIASLTPQDKKNQKQIIIRILEKMFLTNNSSSLNENCLQLLSDFLIAKDSLGSTALHYACFMHNFEIIEFILSYSSSSKHTPEYLLTTAQDASQQTAYSLLFWQIGRVTFNKEDKEKIKLFTNKYVLNNTNGFSSKAEKLEKVARAYFPCSSTANFNAENSDMGKFILDYPLDLKHSKTAQTKQQISPLLYAINRQSFDMCKFLLKDLGFDANTVNSNKVCALAYAVRVNNLNLVKLLLNFDYETNSSPDEKKQKFGSNSDNKAGARMKSLLTGVMKPAKKNYSEEDEENSTDFSEEEEKEDEQMNEDNLEQTLINETTTTNDESNAKFKVKSNIILNHLDNKLRSIFHHLACSLDYGSFHNIEICKLLFSAFSSEDKPLAVNGNKLPLLSEFLKRVDSNVITASDYAIKNGNIELYEEFRKVLSKSNAEVTSDQVKLNKFNVNDKFYTGFSVNYANDAESFLKKYLDENEQASKKASEHDYFTVDPLSNMNKIGCLVWDEKANIPYDIILTKTDVSYGLYGMHNFYKMQLITHSFNHAKSEENGNGKMEVDGEESKQRKIKFDENQMCVLFTRWGRIGDQGQFQRTPFSNFREAKEEFFKIFKLKTGNDFKDTVVEKKKPFENKPRRYNLVKFESRRRPKLKDINFDLFEPNAVSSSRAKIQISLFEKSRFKTHESNVNYRLFWEDLLDVNFLKSQTHVKTKLSADYLPLTQISGESIQRASDILNKQLKPLIERRMDIEKLSKKEYLMEYMNLLDQINKYSNDFYELIPQMNYNYEKLVPISNEKELDAQLCTLNQLNNAQIACRILMGAKYAMNTLNKNPFDYVYSCINCKLDLLNPNDSEAQYILRYIWTDKQPDVKGQVKRIFKFERPGEQDRFDKVQLPSGSSKLKNRFMLWHGTGTENLISIMCRGLIKAPHDAKWNGQRFGKGLYFSDSFQTSSMYTNGKKHSVKGSNGIVQASRNYMLLCEVALGKIKEIRSSYETVESLPSGYDSIKALGRKEPDSNNNVNLPNGAILPLGEKLESKLKPGESYYMRSLDTNQYVVYNESQVCIRYIVQYTDEE